MDTLERRLATTKEFRDLVRSYIRFPFFMSYTDCINKNKHDDKRYVGIRLWPQVRQHITKHDIDNIEFMLWMRGKTAHTRCTTNYIRGTCILEK
jgi:hypothetical protein